MSFRNLTKNKSKHLTSAVFTIIIIFFAAVIFNFLLSFFLYNYHHVDFCEEFVRKNSAINRHFGSIEKIRAHAPGSGGDESGGTTNFIVKGTEKRGKISIKWRSNNGSISVEEISTRVGFSGSKILWPESKANEVNYMLPSNIWDGMIGLGLSLLILVFYFDSKGKARLSKIFYSLFIRNQESLQKLRYIFLIVFVVSMIYSILLFMNVIII